MSRALISIDEARRHLRYDQPDGFEAFFDDLHLKVLGASEAVLAYLKSGADQILDSNGDVPEDSAGTPIVPANVKAATLLMLGYLDKDRDNDQRREYEQGYLPRPVTALLYSLRDPALR